MHLARRVCKNAFLVFIPVILAVYFTACSPIGSQGNTDGQSAAPLTASPSQIIVEAIDSEVLGRTLQTAVYLPPNYKANETYPVVYLFHGHGGGHEQWLHSFLGQHALDALIEKGEIAPLIVVCPQMDASYGLNSDTQNRRKISKDGQLYIDVGRYEDYFFQEVIPTIESKYTVSKEPKKRSVGGFSMGGHMALRMGFDHPELFGKIGAHSAPIKTPEVNFTGIIKDTIYPTDDLRAARDPFLMADNLILKDTLVYMDIGDEDSSYAIEGMEALYFKLIDSNVQAGFYVGQGGHDASYISSQIVEYFRFYGATLD